MTGAFDEIAFTWAGERVVLPDDRLWAAIKRVEDVSFTPEARADVEVMGQPRATTIAEALAALMRFAGVEVETIEVYKRLNAGDKEIASAVEAMNALMGLTRPPKALRKGGPEGNRQARRAARARSSKKPTSSPSAAGA